MIFLLDVRYFTYLTRFVNIENPRPRVRRTKRVAES